jgi:hypothetical protein
MFPLLLTLWAAFVSPASGQYGKLPMRIPLLSSCSSGGYGASVPLDDPVLEDIAGGSSHHQQQRSLISQMDNFGRAPPVPLPLLPSAKKTYPQGLLGLGQQPAGDGKFSPTLPPTKDLYFPPPDIPRGPAPFVIAEPSKQQQLGTEQKRQLMGDLPSQNACFLQSSSGCSFATCHSRIIIFA